MKIVQLDSFEQISDYGIQWNDLLKKSADNHVFLTYEWLTTWWKHFGENRDLVLLVAVDGGKIIAAAPLMRSTYRLFGLKLKNIEFVGSLTSDYAGFILTDKHQECTNLFFEYLKDYSWDCIELKCLPEQGQTASALKSMPSNLGHLKEREMDICPYSVLSSTIDEYYKGLSTSFKRDLRRKEKKLRKNYTVGFKLYDEFSSLKESMNVLVDLHQMRMKSLDKKGVFHDSQKCDFHLELAERFDEKGWLYLSFLTANDEPISAEYCFSYNQKAFNYLAGFNIDYGRYSIGNLGTKYAVDHAIKMGLKEFDFMRGAHSYKSHWNTLNRKNIELSMTRFKPVPKLYNALIKSDRLSSLSSKLRQYVSN
jgi:CelD/BcsL family acetyltransferase involved in cellulose biosynthesis